MGLAGLNDRDQELDKQPGRAKQRKEELKLPVDPEVVAKIHQLLDTDRQHGVTAAAEVRACEQTLTTKVRNLRYGQTAVVAGSSFFVSPAGGLAIAALSGLGVEALIMKWEEEKNRCTTDASTRYIDRSAATHEALNSEYRKLGIRPPDIRQGEFATLLKTNFRDFQDCNDGRATGQFVARMDRLSDRSLAWAQQSSFQLMVLTS